MIRRIALKNWRAYEEADIPFEPGTTFVVAPNGIGKTSLLEAAEFALTGRHGDLVSPVQLGADQAEVELALQLPDSRILIVNRTLPAGEAGQSVLSARIGDSNIDEAALAIEIARSFDTTPEFIARNALLRETLRDGTGLDPREQLSRAFGLSDRRSSAEALTARLPRLESEAKELTGQLKKGRKEAKRLEAELDEAEQHLASCRQLLSESRERLRVVSAQRDARRTYEEAIERRQRWTEATEQLLGLVADHLPGSEAQRLRSDMAQLVVETETVHAELQATSAALRARLEMTEAALAELLDADAECPVCLRPLADADRSTAEARHRERAEEVTSQAAALDVEASATLLRERRELLRRCDAIGDEPHEPAAPDDNDVDSDEYFQTVSAELEQASAEVRAAEAAVASLEADLAEARDLENVHEQSVQAWRRWALTSAAASTITSTVEDVLVTEVEPIRAALDDRWTLLFPDRSDLNFDLDGGAWRRIRGMRLDVEAFSAGERIAARLLLQLAILSAATSVSFCWVDEPLEHLDPQARRLVAGMLSHGRSALGFRQLVVTTYEEELAQRLAESDETTHIEYVRAPAVA